MGQMKMKWILNIGKKYFYIGQGYSGERCGPWASCLTIMIIESEFAKIIYAKINGIPQKVGNPKSPNLCPTKKKTGYTVCKKFLSGALNSK
jgi:hypothetical protein